MGSRRRPQWPAYRLENSRWGRRRGLLTAANALRRSVRISSERQFQVHIYATRWGFKPVRLDWLGEPPPGV